MSFEKENTHGKGRPAGSLNKFTAEIREIIYNVLVEKSGNLSQWFDEIKKPQDKISAYSKLLSFVVPKITEVNLINEARTENKKEEYNFDLLTKEEFQELCKTEPRRDELLGKCLVNKDKVSSDW